MMGVNLSAGGSLQWFRNALCQADVARAKRDKVDVYDLLTQEAAAVPPGCEGLFFLPYLSGERTPHADPRRPRLLYRADLGPRPRPWSGRSWKGSRTRLRDSLEIIEGLGVPVRQIRASGGGSRSPLLAADPGRLLRPQGRDDQQRRRGGLRRRLVGRRGSGLFQGHRQACAATISVVQETPPDRAAKRRYDRAFPALPAALSLAERRLRGDLRVRMLIWFVLRQA